MLKKKSSSKLFKTLIVGVDFSPYSKIVVRQAEKLAHQFKASIVLVHAALVTWDATGSGINVPQMDLDEIKMSLKKFYNLNESSKATIEVRRGGPVEVILSIAKKYESPLIIVGSQGNGAISRFILGSHAETIALKSPYPVWVHRGQKIVPLKKVLVPTDLSSYSKNLIAQIKNWSKVSPLSTKYIFVKPQITPLLNYRHYRQMNHEFSLKLEKSIDQFKKAEGSMKIDTFSAADPSVKISKLGKKYDVIAMTPHEKSGVLRKFGPVTAKVIRLAETPVLVVKS